MTESGYLQEKHVRDGEEGGESFILVATEQSRETDGDTERREV